MLIFQCTLVSIGIVKQKSLFLQKENCGALEFQINIQQGQTLQILIKMENSLTFFK